VLLLFFVNGVVVVIVICVIAFVGIVVIVDVSVYSVACVGVADGVVDVVVDCGDTCNVGIVDVGIVCVVNVFILCYIYI